MIVNIHLNNLIQDGKYTVVSYYWIGTDMLMWAVLFKEDIDIVHLFFYSLHFVFI